MPSGTETYANRAELTNICTIQNRHLFFNQIDGNVGINWQGYPQKKWKTRLRVVLGRVEKRLNHSSIFAIYPVYTEGILTLIGAAFALDF